MAKLMARHLNCAKCLPVYPSGLSTFRVELLFTVPRFTVAGKSESACLSPSCLELNFCLIHLPPPALYFNLKFRVADLLG